MQRNLGWVNVASLVAMAATLVIAGGCRGERLTGAASNAALRTDAAGRGVVAAFVPLPTPLARADDGTPAPVPPPDAPPAVETPPPPPPPATTVDAPPAPAAPVQSPEDAARAFADDLARRQAVENQKGQFVVAQLLDSARAARQAGRLEDAERDLMRAQALAPTNKDVADELSMVRQLLGRRDATATGTLEDLRRRQQVLIDEQKTSAENLAQQGRNALAKGAYDEAIEHFQNALNIIVASPYTIDWRNLKPACEQGLAQAVQGRKATASAEKRRATEESIGEMAREEETRLLQEQARLESTMFSAIEAFDRDEFDLAISQSEAILLEQPDNVKARELRDAAMAARHEKVSADTKKKEQRAFAQWRDEMEATRNLEHKILRWPSQSFWGKITRARASQRASFGGGKADPDAARLAAKLKTTLVNLAVDGRPFKEVVQTLQIQTGVNIVIDARMTDVPDANVTPINVEQIPLEQVLNMLKATAEDVVWTIRGNVVLFTKKNLVKYALTLKTHSVADLTQGLTDFRPPKIDLVMSDQVNDEESPLFGGESEETVKHTAEVQEQVAKFLDDLRAFAGIVVTVDTRFLTVSDNFLRDIGMDWRGLGGQTPGTLVNLDDVTNGLENKASAGRDNGGPGLPAGAALKPSAGAYFNDGSDGDFRGRTEQIFERPLGSVLSSLGGASLGFAFLDDLQLNAILKAVEKTQSGRTLTAPTITVYNTQRANLTVVNQLSYIQDFDVEVAQTSFIADPIIGVIQDGLTLDVRPTVSNDRKYITLELEPTVAKLVEPIPTFSTTLASSFSPVIIQLPELRLQRARTTVKIPDGGTIVIGGLKNINTVDRQSEIPVLGKIPVLGFLFSRKGRSDELSNLMIIVRARVTDLQEQEAMLRGR